MNNLGSVIAEVSSSLGLQVFVEKIADDKSDLFMLRFAGLSESNSFSLVLSRSWKTTQIRFKPDAFGSNAMGFLCNQLQTKFDLIDRLIDENRSSFSAFLIELDGGPYSQSTNDSTPKSSLKLEVELLSPESALEHGLVSDEESKLISFVLNLIGAILPISYDNYTNPDEIIGYPEGASSKVLVNKYERDPRNRKIAIDQHGYRCLACDFNFLETYGAIGDQYIVVHHIIPVSELGQNYILNPVIDLVTLCANCHAMVHRHDPPLGVDELRAILGKYNDSKFKDS